ncbi:hypothetical protein ACP275_03G107200 [Erythranthe tilingii]
MRGVGGPLLCISDLLNDVAEETSGVPHDHAPPSDAADVSKLPPSDIPKLFQENFNELKGALEGGDHSWTALTLKLCSALETANKLVDSSNSSVASLSEKVDELERIVNRRDSAITAAKEIQGSLKLYDQL